MKQSELLRRVRDGNQEPIKRSHKAQSVAKVDGSIWPDHVKVQIIPGMERTQGVPGNVYVDPASVKRVDVREWGGK